MNPDLAMFGEETGQELLKKTGSVNHFRLTYPTPASL